MKIFLLSFLLFIFQKTHALHVIIDPGHGGVDTGAVYNNTVESKLVLNISQKLAKQLEDKGLFQTTLTRTKDQNLSLQERTKIAEQKKGDFFVSLHANSANDKRAKGMEVFFQSNLSPDEESLYLANLENQNQKINKLPVNQEGLSKKAEVLAILTDLHNQGRIKSSHQFTKMMQNSWGEKEKASSPFSIKQGPFYVLSNTSIPSVLIEVGFLSNPKEAKMLQNNEYQNQIVEKIYAALTKYKEVLDKASPPNLN